MRIAVVTLALAALTLAPAASADWASFHADSRNTGYLPGSTYPVFEDVWWSNKTLANAQITASPVVKDNIVVVADLAGLVRGLDGESGGEMWSFKMPAAVEGTPAIAGERVYVVDAKGNLKALNLKTGIEEKPQVVPALLGATLGSIREHEGKLFVGTEKGEMKAFQASTLTHLWTFDSTKYFTTMTTTGTPPNTQTTCSDPIPIQPVRGAPAVFNNRVYFGSHNHFVYAIDENGNGDGTTTLLWYYKTGDIITGSPSINIIDSTTSRAIVGSYDGKVYAFSLNNQATLTPCSGGKTWFVSSVNNPVWKYSVPSVVDSVTGQTQISKVHSSPANTGDKVYVGANNGRVYALDAKTTDPAGKLLWNTTAGDSLRGVTSSPAVANGHVVVGSENKNVYWLNAATGAVEKTFAADAAITTSPAIDGNRVFVSTRDGRTYMFGPKVPPRADLTVTTVTATTKLVSATVQNLGDAAAPNSTVRFLVDDIFVADVPLKGLAPGASQVVSSPATIKAGAHRVAAKADFGTPDAVKESNEGNNLLTKSLTVAAAPPPADDSTSEAPKKKGPDAGVAVLTVLVGAAFMMRRRRQ